ncbi:MAG: lipopolysaccharide biosynthesis protein [Gammaproteobacteria bacterium]
MIVRDAAWIALGQAIVVVAGLAATRVLTTLLPPAIYGQVSLVMGLGALGLSLLCTPFLQAALRAFPDARNDGQVGALRKLTASFLRQGLLGVTALMVLAGVAWPWISSTPVPLLAFIAAAGWVVCDAWRSYEAGLLNGARRQKEFAARASLDAIARPAAAIGLIWWLGPAALHAVLGFALGSGAVGLLLRRRTVGGEPGIDPERIAEWCRGRRESFLRYALPLIPLAALVWVMSMSDRYFLDASWGSEAVGLYWAAYALGSQPFIAVNGLVHSTLRPVLYDAVARGDAAKEQRTLRVWIPLAAAIALTGFALITVLAEPVCALLLGPEYRSAAELLPWIAGAYALQMVQQAFEIILFAHGRSKRLVLLQALAAAVAVALYLLLIPRLGALGAALGTLGAMLVTMTAACFLSGAPRKLFGPLPASV